MGVLGMESPILGNFAPPEAQNLTNRRKGTVSKGRVSGHPGHPPWIRPCLSRVHAILYDDSNNGDMFYELCTVGWQLFLGDFTAPMSIKNVELYSCVHAYTCLLIMRIRQTAYRGVPVHANRR